MIKISPELNVLIRKCGVKSRPLEIDEIEKKIALAAQLEMARILHPFFQQKLLDKYIRQCPNLDNNLDTESLEYRVDMKINYLKDARWDVLMRAVDVLVESCARGLKKKGSTTYIYNILTIDPKAYEMNRVKFVALFQVEKHG